MISEKLAVTGLVALVVVLVVIVVTLAHYNSNVLPFKMAEKGYCWRSIPGNAGFFAYQPCEQPCVPVAVKEPR